MRAIRSAMAFVKPYWHEYLLAFLLVVIIGSIYSVPWLLISKIDRFVSMEQRSALRLAIFVFGGVFGTHIFASIITQHLYNFFRWHVGMRVAYDLRTRFFAHLLGMPMSFFQGRPVGELIYRASTDVDAALPLILDHIPILLSSAFTAASWPTLAMTCSLTWPSYSSIRLGQNNLRL